MHTHDLLPSETPNGQVCKCMPCARERAERQRREAPEEYVDVEYHVTLSLLESVDPPPEAVIKRVLYQGLSMVNTEDAIDVTEVV